MFLYKNNNYFLIDYSLTVITRQFILESIHSCIINSKILFGLNILLAWKFLKEIQLPLYYKIPFAFYIKRSLICEL